MLVRALGYGGDINLVTVTNFNEHVALTRNTVIRLLYNKKKSETKLHT